MLAAADVTGELVQCGLAVLVGSALGGGIIRYLLGRVAELQTTVEELHERLLAAKVEDSERSIELAGKVIPMLEALGSTLKDASVELRLAGERSERERRDGR